MRPSKTKGYKFGYFYLRRQTLLSEYKSTRITGWPLTFSHFGGSMLGKHRTVRQRTVLTRLRQNGRPCAMMLMLKILRTFWGGNCSLAASLGSARSSGWSPGGTSEVSFPQRAVGIFLRAPDDENRGIGQCRSIAEQSFYCIISRNPRWMSGACCRERLWFLPFADVSMLSSLNLLTYLLMSPPCWVSPFKISSECDISVAPQPGGAAAFRPWEEDSPNQSVLPQTGAVESAPMTLLSGMWTSSRPA